MDAFYAAVEVRDDPRLAGQPLIIGHEGPRGVVSTCSYEARRFGVHSAMPSVTAARLCPDAIWLPGRMRRYQEISRALRDLFRAATPVVEPVSIDEAFLDMTGIALDFAHGQRLAADLKAAISAQHQITASVGVAPNKFLAKIASDMEKPDGLVLLCHEDIPRLLWPLPIRRLWGVGPRLEARLRALSLQTVGDLAAFPLAKLEGCLGTTGARHLQHLAHGEDQRAVETGGEPKSISEERTYGRDLRHPGQIDRALLARAEGVARDLRRKGYLAHTVHLKVRTGDFTTWTRSFTLPEPTNLTETLVAAARDLFRHRIHLAGRGVRLLGVGASHLLKEGPRQADLFPDAGTQQARRLARITDQVRDRFGESSVTRARLANPPTPSEDGDDDPPEASSLPTVD